MAILLAEPWDFTVFKKRNSSTTGGELIIERTVQLKIDKKASVRKLFREVRKKFEAKTSVQLFCVTMGIDPETNKEVISSESEISKSDSQIKNCKEICNGAKLRVQIHPTNPEMFTIFVTLPSGTNKTFLLEEKEKTQKLYQTVRQQLNSEQSIFKLKYGESEIILESTTDTLLSTIFDGIQLTVCINPKKWSLNIILPQRSAMINIPEFYSIALCSKGTDEFINSVHELLVLLGLKDATVSDLFRKVESMLPSKDLRLGIADKTLCKDQNGQDMLSKYAEHTSQVVVLLRQRGGAGVDYNTPVQLLHNEATIEVLTSCEGSCCWKKLWKCCKRST